MHSYLILSIGVFCAAIGGELFVRGSVGIAHWARVSPGIIGATIAAFATSSPELTVSVTAAAAGTPQIALGDALGSNVVNVALILGAALVISPMTVPRRSVKRDFPAALLVPVMTAALAADGRLSRADGLIMICAFGVWLAAVVKDARLHRSAADAVLGEHRPWLAAVQCAGGLVFLLSAGRLIVAGGVAIAKSFDIDPFVIGATVIAVGTSAPEIATAVIAALRGHDEVGLGTILGSNVFNGLFVTSVAALIMPMAVDWRDVETSLLFGFVSVAVAYPPRDGRASRGRGMLLLGLYGLYLAVVIVV